MKNFLALILLIGIVLPARPRAQIPLEAVKEVFVTEVLPLSVQIGASLMSFYMLGRTMFSDPTTPNKKESVAVIPQRASPAVLDQLAREQTAVKSPAKPAPARAPLPKAPSESVETPLPPVIVMSAESGQIIESPLLPEYIVNPSYAEHFVKAFQSGYDYSPERRFKAVSRWGALDPDLVKNWSLQSPGPELQAKIQRERLKVGEAFKAKALSQSESAGVGTEAEMLPPAYSHEILFAPLRVLESTLAQNQGHEFIDRLYELQSDADDLIAEGSRADLGVFWRDEITRAYLQTNGLLKGMTLVMGREIPLRTNTPAAREAARDLNHLLLLSRTLRTAWSYQAQRDHLLDLKPTKNRERIHQIALAENRFRIVLDKYIGDLIRRAEGEEGDLAEQKRFLQEAKAFAKKLERSRSPLESDLNEFTRRQIPFAFPWIEMRSGPPVTFPSSFDDIRKWREWEEYLRQGRMVEGEDAHYGHEVFATGLSSKGTGDPKVANPETRDLEEEIEKALAKADPASHALADRLTDLLIPKGAPEASKKRIAQRVLRDVDKLRKHVPAAPEAFHAEVAAELARLSRKSRGERAKFFGVTEEVLARRERDAIDFYYFKVVPKLNVTDLCGYLRGIDWAKPVNILLIRKGAVLVQYQTFKREIGSYFGIRNEAATRFGVSDIKKENGELHIRTAQLVRVIDESLALRSTAARIKDVWSVGSLKKTDLEGLAQKIPPSSEPRNPFSHDDRPGINTIGGAIQIFIPDGKFENLETEEAKP